MLSNIPNVERVDVNKTNEGRSNFSSSKENYRNRDNSSSNYSQNNRNFDRNKSNYRSSQKNIDYKGNFTNEADSLKTNKISETNQNKDSSKTTLSDLRKPGSLKQRVDDAVKKFNHNGKNNFLKNQNLDSKKKTPVLEASTSSQTSKEKQEDVKTNQELKNNTLEKKEVTLKKPKVLPKLTDKIIKNFVKILEDVDGKNTSRILNEKFRRIGSAKNSDLNHKLKGFKQNKIFALVTDKELDLDLLNLCKEKGVSFLVVPKSKIKEDKEINIVTYNDLKK